MAEAFQRQLEQPDPAELSFEDRLAMQVDQQLALTNPTFNVCVWCIHCGGEI